jgi:hypothetical protein
MVNDAPDLVKTLESSALSRDFGLKIRVTGSIPVQVVVGGCPEIPGAINAHRIQWTYGKIFLRQKITMGCCMQILILS